MLKEGTNNVVGGSTWSRVCDTCRSAPCILYCHADSAYLCLSCDERVHAANRVASRHKRVLVCEACERAPAAFLCKADAASLCSSCDADIHSANPLASRHHRVPILPISGPLLEEFEEEKVVVVVDDGHYDNDEDEIEAASWLLPNPLKDDDDKEDQNDDDNGFLFGCKYLDHNLVDCNCCDHNNQFSSNVYQQQQIYNHNNNTVPQNIYALVPVQVPQQLQHFKPGLDFDSSKAGFSYEGSLSQSVSVSSMDVGVVPESTISDISMSHSKSSIGTNDLFPPLPMSSHYLTPMDREAKVLRYKEKKKTRKFEKKIRYASRKAYAETRPRIKGRFAKRTDVEAEVDQMFSSTLFSTEVGDSFFASF